jgi:hypothetical protein
MGGTATSTSVVDAAASPARSLNERIADFRARITALDQNDADSAQALIEAMIASDLPGAYLAILLRQAATQVKSDAAVAVREGMRARAALESSRTPIPEENAGPSPYLLPDPLEPATDPEALAWILDQMVRVILRRVICSQEAAWAIALWIACTWGVRQLGQPGGPTIFPRLLITAPTMRAGKSTLLETVMALSRSPIMVGNITVAAMFRTISAFFPTLGLDEADNSLRNNQELVGVTNSGHARNGSVLRTVEIHTRSAAGGSKKDFEPRAFSTFSPMVIAGIGHQARTTADRAIRVELQRQPASALQDPMEFDKLATVRQRLAPGLAAHADDIANAMGLPAPAIPFPKSIGSRDRDNWRPLIRVAGLAEGAWLDRVQAAMVALCGDGEDRRSGGEQLLADIRTYARAPRLDAVGDLLSRWAAQKANAKLLAAGMPARATSIAATPHPLAAGGPPGHARTRQPADFIFSADLAAWLMDKDDSIISKERDVQAAKLKIANLLRGFNIKPHQRSAGRGYWLRSLKIAWRRYL